MLRATKLEVKSNEDKFKIMVEYRTGDIHIPQVSLHEALKEMAKDFIKTITEKTTPRSSAALGLEVVRILEKAQESIKQNGKEVMI